MQTQAVFVVHTHTHSLLVYCWPSIRYFGYFMKPESFFFGLFCLFLKFESVHPIFFIKVANWFRLFPQRSIPFFMVITYFMYLQAATEKANVRHILFQVFKRDAWMKKQCETGLKGISNTELAKVLLHRELSCSHMLSKLKTNHWVLGRASRLNRHYGLFKLFLFRHTETSGLE